MLALAVPAAAQSGESGPIKFSDTQYEPVDWSDIDGWADDDHATAFAAFLESCRALNASRQAPPPGTVAVTVALKAVCARGF
ncbi:MAG: hypothetical protein KGQ47_17515, partial [Hyphomicrobiales bacterium]|nr:hypothetical protein [Hyphomicrobiales bacterium]